LTIISVVAQTRGVTHELSKTVGAAIRRIRISHGISVEDLARASRSIGLSWSRPTLASIEAGKRGLAFEEILALPIMFGWVNVQVSVLELLGEDGLDLTPLWHATPAGLAELFNGGSDLSDSSEIHLGANIAERARTARKEWERTLRRHPTLPEDTGLKALAAAEKDEATQKASRRLHQTVLDITVASINLWGRSLTEERNARVADEDLPEPTRTALRGRATRVLLDELRTYFVSIGGDQ
jgi:transcriptional regulator with XRE-family HTH domain